MTRVTLCSAFDAVRRAAKGMVIGLRGEVHEELLRMLANDPDDENAELSWRVGMTEERVSYPSPPCHLPSSQD